MGIARRVWPLSRLAAWQDRVDATDKQLRKELRSVTARLGDVERQLQDTTLRAQRAERFADQMRLSAQMDARQHDAVARLPHLLNESRIRQHVERAIAAAPLCDDPFEHVVVNDLLPADVYELVAEARPPEPFFDPRDPAKQDLRMPISVGPRLMTEVWRFVDEVLAMQMIRPAALAKFDEPLRRYIHEVFGEGMQQQVRALPPSTSSGRLALRKPGYFLGPHRDPKRSMLTCLIYLATPGEGEEYGTQLFRVRNDTEANYKQTYFPEQAGATCELVKTVPFKANSALIFLNSRGAHGAQIPKDAAPIDRYTYQFYIAPDTDALGALIRTLPKERRAMWANKASLDSME